MPHPSVTYDPARVDRHATMRDALALVQRRHDARLVLLGSNYTRRPVRSQATSGPSRAREQIRHQYTRLGAVGDRALRQRKQLDRGEERRDALAR